MARTNVLVEGLQDPAHGRGLSGAWAGAGFVNTLDLSGQCAVIESYDERASGIARAFGVELRDRTGQTFTADNDLTLLREEAARQWKGRLAQALVYGLPAVALHYVAPILAEAGGSRKFLYPWFFEMLLAGWVCVVGAWPVLWQGALSLAHLRMTAELFFTAVLLGAFVPSAVGVATIVVRAEPWFSPNGPTFHAVVVLVWSAAWQRWRAARHGSRLAGRADLMVRGWRHVVFAWAAMTLAITFFRGWHTGLAVGMLLPLMGSLAGVNRWTPGAGALLPVAGFLPVVLFFPSAHGREIEAAGVMLLVTTAMVGWGWERWGAGERGSAEKTPPPARGRGRV